MINKNENPRGLSEEGLKELLKTLRDMEIHIISFADTREGDEHDAV